MTQRADYPRAPRCCNGQRVSMKKWSSVHRPFHLTRLHNAEYHDALADTGYPQAWHPPYFRVFPRIKKKCCKRRMSNPPRGGGVEKFFWCAVGGGRGFWEGARRRGCVSAHLALHHNLSTLAAQFSGGGGNFLWGCASDARRHAHAVFGHELGALMRKDQPPPTGLKIHMRKSRTPTFFSFIISPGSYDITHEDTYGTHSAASPGTHECSGVEFVGAAGRGRRSTLGRGDREGRWTRQGSNTRCGAFLSTTSCGTLRWRFSSGKKKLLHDQGALAM